MVKKILETVRNLSSLPFTGRIVPEFSDETVREKFAYSYRIIYLIREEAITVAAVIHGKRLLELDVQL